MELKRIKAKDLYVFFSFYFSFNSIKLIFIKFCINIESLYLPVL